MLCSFSDFLHRHFPGLWNWVDITTITGARAQACAGGAAWVDGSGVCLVGAWPDEDAEAESGPKKTHGTNLEGWD